MEPKVSVVIPVYNGEKYLAECLESAQNQTWPNFEIIVVDDGSTDASECIYRKFPGIRIIRQENRGQSSARNTGAQEADGKYIAFLDQDDLWYPGRLARGVAVLEKNTRYDMVYSNLDRIDEAGNVVHRKYLDLISIQPKRSIVDCLIKDMYVLPGTVLIRRDPFLALGGFDERLSGYEDDDLFLRVFQRGEMYYIKDALLQWRIYPTSYSYTPRMERSRIIYIDKLMKQFPNKPEMGEYFTRDLIAPRFLSLYVLLYTQALRFESSQGDAEHLRAQIGWMLRHSENPSLTLWAVARLPVPAARAIQKFWRSQPRIIQRQWERLAQRMLIVS